MGKKRPKRPRVPVLACMTRKEDLSVLQSVLVGQSADAVICPNISELCRSISIQVEAAVISGDMLTAKSIPLLEEALNTQPPWSDLPIIVSVKGGAGSLVALKAIHSLGNVLVLDHSFTPAALKNTLLMAYRIRDRQRWVRDLIDECDQAVQALRASRDQLELQAQERTKALKERASQLNQLMGELISSEQRERQRMAKILHDHLQQVLVSAKYRVSPLNRAEDPTVKATAKEIDELLSEAIRASRSLTSDLSPPIIHESGLRMRMEWLASFMSSQNGLSIQLNMDEDFVSLDENTKLLLFDAVRELLLNSVRHGKARSAEVSARQIEGDRMEVAVVDHGSGFDPGLLKSEGLGLFRIRNRLEMIGGRLEIESSPGKGSKISIIMPLPENAPAPIESGRQSESAIPRREKPLPGMIRILIVDDHPVMRQGLSTSLSQEPDIAIIGEAADGKIALEKARTLFPDIVLMDIGMPKMGGIEATKIIHSEMPMVRVIGLSMFEEKEQANDMFEAGAVAYLIKTCSVDILTSTIRKCAGKRALAAGAP
jgi:signal transduction histidine kinase/CheY-like chemotaxis protein